MSIKVFLVEDHDLVREGVAALLKDEPDINIVGEAINGEDFFLRLRAPFPDIVLMDMNMPHMGGLECTKQLKQDYPSIKTLILSMHNNENYLIEMLDSGANGYILKNASKGELTVAIKKIINNGIYISSEFTATLLSKYKAMCKIVEQLPKQDIDIPERELEVLNFIADGLTNTEIANHMSTSVRTIETWRQNLLKKTRTNNTATLIRFAVQNRLIE